MKPGFVPADSPHSISPTTTEKLNNLTPDMTSPAPNDPISCALLALPGELRNNIYDYVLDTATHPADSHIPLEATAPPSIALALTCRDIHEEFVSLCHSARHSYFANQTFTIDLTSEHWTPCIGGNPRHSIGLIRNQDLERIRSLSFEADRTRLKIYRHEGEGWQAVVQGSGCATLYGRRWDSFNLGRVAEAFDAVVEGRGVRRDCGWTKQEVKALLRQWRRR